MGANAAERVDCVVHGSAPYRGKQGLDYTPGISAETVGSHALWLGSVVLPPGGRTKSHVHEHHESALYMISGEEVEVFTGDRLEHREVVHPGDYLYFRAGLPHVAVNRTATPTVFLASRTDPSEQESVLVRPDLDELVP